MISDLPGEITKQIFVAPPRIMRSTRYSLTAQGRSTPASRRLGAGRGCTGWARGCADAPSPAPPACHAFPGCFAPPPGPLHARIGAAAHGQEFLREREGLNAA